MRWSPTTTGGSRFFVTKAEYRVSALNGRDGYGSDAEYPAPSSQVAHSDFRNGSFTSFPLSRRVPCMWTLAYGDHEDRTLNGAPPSSRARG
jgi:hypothetical protein